MKKNKCLRFNKLSLQIPMAGLAVSQRKLTVLQQLIMESKQISKSIEEVAEKLRQVAAPEQQPFLFTSVLAENEQNLRVIFRDCDDIKYRPFMAGNKQALLVYLDGMTDITLLEKNVIEILMSPLEGSTPNLDINVDVLVNQLLTSAGVTIATQAEQAIESIMIGNAMLLMDTIDSAITISATKFVKRSVEDAQTEGTVMGPHDGFTETLSDNIVLIRRRTRDTNLKVQVKQIGDRSKTALAIIYIGNLVKPGLVEEVERRLAAIRVDTILLSGTLAEYIVDHPWSPFPQTQFLERPASVVSAIYDGRVAIFLDNDPYVIVVPCTTSALLQITDDYILPSIVSSLIRIIRYIAAGIASYLPAVYIAIVSYHPGMMPTTLAISVAELRARTPFPSILEVIVMEILIALFEEAVIRLPGKLAGAASMIGGFVIGTTVVQAGLVNPLLVVVVAITTIASFTMPSYIFSVALRWLRIPMIILASALGLYGVMLGILAVLVHVCSLRSFGESYVGGIFNVDLITDWKDEIVRLPATLLKKRPKEFGAQDKVKAGDQHS